MLSSTLRLKFCYLKIIHIVHTSYHLKIIRHIPKNLAKEQVCLYSWDYAINHNENEGIKEKRSHRWGINRPGSTYRHKCGKYKKCFSVMMLICFKTGLSPSKKISCYFLEWKPSKNDENGFLFHLKSSFRSQVT